MSTLRISDAPLLPDVDGTEKIPTGGRGDYAISVDQIKDHIFQDVGKELVGLGNVDNTSDLDKPVSTAQQAALNLKADKTYVDTNLDLKADKTNVYTRSETSLALSKKADLINGVVPENQIPSSFNDVLEFTTPNLPIIGESGKIYVTTDTNKTWRWATNKYVEISGWSPDSVSKRVTIPTYNNSADGINSVTGVAEGAYFNVRSEDDDTVAIEYQNLGGVATQTGKSYPSNLPLVMVGEAVEKIDTKLQRDILSVWDFFTTSEKQAYNLALINGTSATYNSYRPVQEFFDYIAANDVGTAYCSGTFYTSQGILFGGSSYSKTKKILGEFNLCAIAGNPIHTLFTMQTGGQFAWLGRVHVQGVGGIWYAQRTVQVGLLIGGQYSARDTYITQVDADGGFKEFGVVLGNNTTGSHLDSIRTTRCGSGLEQAGYSLTTSFNLVSEVLTGGPSQRSVLNCTQLPPTASTDISPMLYIDGKLHIVISIDTGTNEVAVFPVITRGMTSGDARWVFGAGLATSGGDASVSRVGKLTGTANGITYASGSLYPLQLGALTSEANFIGAALGRGPSSAHVGGSIQSFYCENQTFDLVRRTRAQLNFTISSEYAMNLDRFFDLSASRSSITGDIVWETASCFDGVFLVYRGYPLSFCGRPAGVNEGSVLVTNPASNRTVVQYRSSYAFTLTAPNDSISKTFGRTGTSCIVINPAASNGAPTGAIVFNAPTGYTVNGQNSVSFSGFVSAARFEVYWTGGTDIVVVPLTLIQSQTSPSASVTYDPPSVDANATIETTVTLTGVVVGDIVQAAFSRYDAGIEISAVVSSANTVTVKFKNVSAAPINLASGTLKVKLV